MTGLTETQVEELKNWLKAHESRWAEQRAYWLDKGRTHVADQCEFAEQAYANVFAKIVMLEGEKV